MVNVRFGYDYSCFKCNEIKRIPKGNKKSQNYENRFVYTSRSPPYHWNNYSAIKANNYTRRSIRNYLAYPCLSGNKTSCRKIGKE